MFSVYMRFQPSIFYNNADVILTIGILLYKFDTVFPRYYNSTYYSFMDSKYEFSCVFAPVIIQHLQSEMIFDVIQVYLI